MAATKILFFSVILPALISLITFSLVWKPWKKDEDDFSGKLWSGAIAIGIGYIAGHIGIMGIPPIPPVEVTQWMIFFAAFGVLFGLLISLKNIPRFIDVFLKAFFISFLLWITLKPMIKYTWDTSQSFIWFSGLFISILLYWFFFDLLSKEFSEGSTLPLILTVISGFSAILTALNGSAFVGQLFGVISATLGSSVLISFIKKGFSIQKGVIPVFVILFTGLILNSYFFVELNIYIIFLILISPLTIFLTKLKPLSNFKTWKIVIIRLILVIIPLSTALALSDFNSPEETQEVEEFDYDYNF